MKRSYAGFVYLPFVLVWMICFYFAYRDTLVWMYERCISPDSYYSHSFLIPFITGYFIWNKREELLETPVNKSWTGLGALLFGAFVHIVGTVLYVFSVSGFSMLLVVFGAVLFLYGRAVTEKLFFPLLFLAFMIPLPIALINLASFPMKMLVAKTGAEVVSLMGIPVFREGFNITIPAGGLLVGNPCSGLRSLISFLALGAVLAYISDMSRPRKCFLFLLAVPIALLSNMVRVPLLILISHFWGLEYAAPESFWHGASGGFVFILGVLLFIYSGKVLEWKR